MRALALALLLGVFLAHDSANLIAEGTKYSPAAVFYMLQGAWSAMLAACLLLFILNEHPSIWRRVAVAAMGIAIFEGLEIPVCRLLVDDIMNVPSRTTMCNYVTGLPVSQVTLSLEIIALVVAIWPWLWKQDEE